MTSESSQEQNLNPLTSSVVACPVNHTHRPVSSSAKKMNGTYGQRCFASLRK